MAIAMDQDIPGVTSEQYDAVVAELRASGTQFEGLIMHTAGAWGDGWRTVDIWESRKAMDRFFHESLRPAQIKVMTARGIAPDGPPSAPQVMTIHDMYSPQH